MKRCSAGLRHETRCFPRTPSRSHVSASRRRLVIQDSSRLRRHTPTRVRSRERTNDHKRPRAPVVLDALSSSSIARRSTLGVPARVSPRRQTVRRRISRRLSRPEDGTVGLRLRGVVTRREHGSGFPRRRRGFTRRRTGASERVRVRKHRRRGGRRAPSMFGVRDRRRSSEPRAEKVHL